MDELPVEIIQKILSLLHQHQKLECMTVCSRWFHLIKGTCLYDTVHIYDNEMLDCFLKDVDNDQSKKTQVKRIVISKQVDKDMDLSTFPHLEVIYSDRYWRISQPMAINTMDNNVIYPFKTIIDANGSCLISFVLTSGLCPYLTSLSVYTHDTYIYGNTFIPLLKAAPNINKLTIKSMIVSLGDLELLHSTVTLLQCLRLERIIMFGDKLPDIIDPATSISSFVCDARSSDPDTDELVARYFYEKYIHAEEIASHFIQLTNHGDIIPNAQTHNDVYNSAISKIKISDCGESKGLNTRIGYHSDIKIQCDFPLECLEHLIQPQQLKHVHTLVLKGTIIMDFNYLKELAVLKNLELSYTFRQENLVFIPVGDFKFSDLVESCPDTLESIKIENSFVDMEKPPTRATCLRQLILAYAKLSGRLDLFISMAFPQLRILKLNACDFNGLKKMDIPHIHLHHFEITVPDTEDGALLVETRFNQRRWYMASRNKQSRTILEKHFDLDDETMFPSTRSKPFYDFKYTAFMILTCASVSRVVVKHPI